MFFQKRFQGPILEDRCADFASTRRFWCHFRFSGFSKRHPLDNLFHSKSRQKWLHQMTGTILSATRETPENWETLGGLDLRFLLFFVWRSMFAFSKFDGSASKIRVFCLFLRLSQKPWETSSGLPFDISWATLWTSFFAQKSTFHYPAESGGASLDRPWRGLRPKDASLLIWDRLGGFV